jgi:hypothetical protein
MGEFEEFHHPFTESSSFVLAIGEVIKQDDRGDDFAHLTPSRRSQPQPVREGHGRAMTDACNGP